MTGMRIGEAAALQWDDIDFETGMLIISKTLYYKTMNDYKFVEPKTRQATVPFILMLIPSRNYKNGRRSRQRFYQIVDSY